MAVTFLVSALCLAAALAVAMAVRNRRRNRLLARIPGPACFLPLFGNMLELLVKVVWQGQDMMALGSAMVKEYGPVLVLWTGHKPYILISNAKDAEVVLSHPAVAYKGQGYKLMEPWLGDGLLLAGGHKWRERRRTIAPAFGVRVLEQFTGVFNKHAAILEQKLRARIDGPAFDVVPHVTLFTLDVISETAMGVPINAQSEGNPTYVAAVKTACRCFFFRNVYPWLRSDALLRLTSIGKMFRDAIFVLHEQTRRVIDRRRAEISQEMGRLSESEDEVGLKQRAVLLDHLLSKSLRGEGISDKDITDEVNTFLFAGHDTTMTSLCFTLHLLSKHPDVQEALAREVLDVVGDSEAVGAQHLPRLKYLECVVKESLRLYPSVPFIVRDCREEFTLPSGYTIPVGAQVGVDLVNLHRDAAAFPKPLEFDPSRFLGEGDADGRHRFAFLPFSAAQRNCIGQRFALMEMKTVLARLVRAFLVLPPEAEGDYQLRVRAEVVLTVVDGVRIRLKRRAQRRDSSPS